MSLITGGESHVVSITYLLYDAAKKDEDELQDSIRAARTVVNDIQAAIDRTRRRKGATFAMLNSLAETVVGMEVVSREARNALEEISRKESLR
jgi:predicted transcriptional regulator